MADETKNKAIVEEQFGHYTALVKDTALLVEAEYRARPETLRTTVQPEGDKWIVSAFRAKKN